MGNIEKSKIIKPRRKFLYQVGGLSLGVGILGLQGCVSSDNGEADESESATAESSAGETLFKISLAEWSLHNALFAEEMTIIAFNISVKEVQCLFLLWQVLVLAILAIRKNLLRFYF